MNKKILIVEDDVAILGALSDKFTREKFNVFSAKDGEEGMALALEKHPDIILLDLVMPIMDGLTMLQKLREDKWGSNAKVILLTNLSSNEKMSEVVKYGVNDYFIKSDWKIGDILKKVKEKLDI